MTLENIILSWHHSSPSNSTHSHQLPLSSIPLFTYTSVTKYLYLLSLVLAYVCQRVMTPLCSQNTIYLANKLYDCPTYSSTPLTFCAPLGKSSLTFCCYVLFVRTCIHVHNLKQHPQKYHLPFLREGLEAHQLGQTGQIAKPRDPLASASPELVLMCMLPGPPFLHGSVKTRASHRQSRHFTELSPQLLPCYFFSKPYLCF